MSIHNPKNRYEAFSYEIEQRARNIRVASASAADLENCPAADDEIKSLITLLETLLKMTRGPKKRSYRPKRGRKVPMKSVKSR